MKTQLDSHGPRRGWRSCWIKRLAGLLAAWGMLALPWQGALAQAPDWTSRVQTLSRMAFMGKAVSNELVRISSDATCSLAVRQAAQAALEKSRPETNDIACMTTFLDSWTVTNAPVVDLALIGEMDGILDYGVSAASIMAADAVDTNSPAWYRAFMNQMLVGLDSSP